MKCDKSDCLYIKLWSVEYPCTECKRNKEVTKEDYYGKKPNMEENPDK